MKKIRQAGKSITVRLIAIFLVIWSVVTILVMTALYYANTQVAQKIVEGQKDRVSYYAAIVNADLSRITELLQRMCVDNNVSAFLRRRRDGDFNYQDYEAFLDSYEQLKNYQSTSMYIDDIFVVIPQTDELLRANHAVTSIPAEYEEQIRRCLEETDEIFFTVEDNMIYLNRGVTGTVIGLEVSVRHLRTTLNALNPGYFDCFLVNRTTGDLLGERQVSEHGRLVYEDIRRNGQDTEEYVAEADGHLYLYDCVETPGNYFQLYLFAEEEKVYEDLYRMNNIWLSLTILVILVPIAMGLLLQRTLSRPMKKLSLAMQAVENQIWNYRLEENESTEFNYVFHQYNNMASQVEILIQQVYEKQLLVEQAKRRQLQAQINPHFLFNSFYMGYRMARNGETEKVASFCMYLGDYFKVLTYAADNLISLGQEMKFIDTYLRLNRMRFEDKLSYEIHIGEELKTFKILPLLLQPLVENAIRHGVEHAQVPCRIIVEVTKADRILTCSVTDDCRMSDEEICTRLRKKINEPEMPSESFGLWNVQKRLMSLDSSGQNGLIFERHEDGIFRVSFRIPTNLR